MFCSANCIPGNRLDLKIAFRLKTALIKTQNMDLIDDLGTDLAMAILVERRASHKLDERQTRTLIGRVRTALVKVSENVNRSGKQIWMRTADPEPDLIKASSAN